MINSFNYYRYEGHSYRIEFDADCNAISGTVLVENGSWAPLIFGWQSILINNTPITEEEAFLLAGIKKSTISPQDQLHEI